MAADNNKHKQPQTDVASLKGLYVMRMLMFVARYLPTTLLLFVFFLFSLFLLFKVAILLDILFLLFGFHHLLI